MLEEFTLVNGLSLTFFTHVALFFGVVFWGFFLGGGGLYFVFLLWSLTVRNNNILTNIFVANESTVAMQYFPPNLWEC